MEHSKPALFRLFGFEIRLDTSWWLLAFLITWTLAAGMFPASYPGLPVETYWWMGMVGAMGIFMSIVLHELSHSLVARHYGLPIRGITLFIFGGVAEMKEEPPHPKAEFVIAIAGPLASLALALGLRAIHLLAHSGDMPVSLVGVADYLATINMLLAVFNLVPAFPLDGGRMLRAFLWHRKGNLVDATRISSRIGSAFALVLMIAGGIAFFRGHFVSGMWWFLIGLFMRGAAAASYGQVIMQEVLRGEPIRRFMNPRPVVVSPAASLQEFVDDYVYKFHFKLFPVVEDDSLVGCVSAEDVKKIPRETWGRRSVRELIRPVSPRNTTAPDTDTRRVLSLMTQPESPGRLMVVERGHLEGIVSLKDLRDFIALKMELDPPRSAV